MDEGSCLIFPVGWAKHNNYGLLANDAYVTHCEKIVKAMKEGKKPEYDETDVTYAQFKDWYENKNSVGILLLWLTLATTFVNKNFLVK